MSLTRFNIATRLGLSFGVLLILLLAIGGLGLLQMSTIQGKLNEITKENNVESALVVAMRNAVTMRAIAVRNVVLLTTEAEMRPEYERLLAQAKAYEEAEGKLGAMLASLPGTTEEEKELFAKIKEAKAATVPLANKAAELGLANKNEEATRLLMKEVRPAQRNWLDLLDKLVDRENKLSQAAAAEAEAHYARARVQMIALAAIALVLGAVIALLIGRGITRPVNEAVGIATRVAGGDLTGRIEVKSGDEVGKLMQALKDMNDSLATLIREARQNSDEVSGAATELAAAASQVASSSQQQSEAASSMAAAVEEMTVSINQISDHARDAHGLSMESSAQAEEGGKVIHATMSEMEKIATSVTESAQIVQELSRQSEQITGIVKVIKDVAEQTNLLALNAAIEAARAGEQGRGFAVVADEVRKLAERTSQSTGEISGMIGNIQEGIHRVTDSMNAGVERVNQGMAQANQAGDAVNRINQDSQRVVGTVNDIGNALKEQSTATNDIAKSVERVAQMAEENNAAVEETAKTAHHLEHLAAALQNTVGRFRI